MPAPTCTWDRRERLAIRPARYAVSSPASAAGSTRSWRCAVRAGARDRSALEQIERLVGERKLDVSSRAVDPLAFAGKVAELVELLVVEAESFDELPFHLFLDRATVGGAADRDLLDPRRALEH